MLKFLILLFIVTSAQETCYTDDDCLELNKCVSHKCAHKDLIPIAATEYVGIVVMLIVSTLANAGGVGGSSMTISLMLLMNKFDPHSSVALTQVFIFAGTFTAILLKIRDRHPTRDRPLIYYDVLMQIVSPILIGVSVGTTVSNAFPGWLILALLAVVVLFLVIDVLKRSLKMYRKEKSSASQVAPVSGNSNSFKSGNNESSKKTNNVENMSNQVEEKKEFSEGGEEVKEEEEKVDESEKSEKSEKLKKNSGSNSLMDIDEDDNNNKAEVDQVLLRRITTIYQDEKKIISIIPLMYFIILAGASIGFSLIKGSSKSKSLVGIKSCSPEYFIVTIFYFVFMILMNIGASVYLVRKTDTCEKTNYIFDEGDVKWTYKKCTFVSIGSVVAGIIVGLLGMGGGNIIGPMLLTLGVRPEISTISSSFTIFISSGTASAQYFISGLIQLDYAAWFFGISVAGSLLGILVLRRIAIKKQRVSCLVFCLFFILFASLIIIPVVGVLNAIKQSQEGNFQLGFKSVC